MDGNGSGLFRLQRRSLTPDQRMNGDYLTFMSNQQCDTIEDFGGFDAVDKVPASTKSSIYVLRQVHKSSGTISVQRTNLTLKEWLSELERRRGKFML